MPEVSQDQLYSLLKQFWDSSSFRGVQKDIIFSVLSGEDTLAILPTGGGKSLCFQLPVLAMEGVCLVISPLIALMKDQVDQLRQKQIPAEYLIAGMNRHEIDRILDNCVYGKVKFLYLSPERLASELVIERMKRIRLSLIAVDEAHCISQWGYDFRPPYLKIAETRKLFPKVPLIALTATATPEVQQDIMEKLGFTGRKVFQQSFFRENLHYHVIYSENKLNRLIEFIRKVQGSGIVYVRSRGKTVDASRFLRDHSISADFYHAGLSVDERSRKQNQWMEGKIKVIVSTNAFGMGINKPDVRFVVHLDLPDTLEAYYQEAGRAGRDGEKSFAVVFYNNSDIMEAETRLERSFPEPEEIKRVYQCLGNYFQLAVGGGEGQSYDFDLNRFCHVYELKPLTVHNSLSLLETEGYISFSEGFKLPSRVYIQMTNTVLYDFLVRNPAFDLLVKTLLRSYGGLFESFVKIREEDIARRTGTSREEVIRLLNLLQKMEVLSYFPRKDLPQLTFITERLDTRNLRIDKDKLTWRKERFKTKLDSVINFVSGQNECRSKTILSYFGETNSPDCGTCDFCLKKRNVPDKENISKRILENIGKSPCSVQDLIRRMDGTDEKLCFELIRQMLEKNVLKMLADGTLTCS